jgi:predicted dehydrogenase
MSTSRIYIIGVGAISGSHIEAIKKLPNSESIEVHVSDINPESLERVKEKYPYIHAHSETSSMLSNPARKDDFVIVSTPPVSHWELTLQALESGRHVLCEKPLAMAEDEARSMLEKAAERQKLLGCCSVRFIGHKATETMKTWIDNGKLGQIYSVNWHHRGQGSRENVVVQPSSSWRAEKSKGGGGVVMDWGAYDFATINDILRPVVVKVISAWLAPPAENAQTPEGVVLDVEFHAGATMLYHREDGTIIPVSYERGHPAYGSSKTEFEFQGTKGSAELDWLGSGLKRYFNKEGKVISEDIPCQPDEAEPKMLERPVSYFYRAVNGYESPSILGKQAVFNFNCLRAVYDCAETGKTQVINKGD